MRCIKTGLLGSLASIALTRELFLPIHPTMSDFPKDGRYRISMGSYTATVLDGQNVLSGQPIDGDTSLVS
jgi:hypothetical protein